MKRKIHITRKDAAAKYMGKALNVWVDSDTPNPPNYKLAAGKTITVTGVNEKEHYLVFQRPGFLGGAVQRYTIPTGADDLELTVTVDLYGKLSVRKKPGKKSTSGSKAGGTAKKPASTTRNLYVTRGSGKGLLEEVLPGVPIRMVVDGTTSKQPLLYEFEPDMIYTITMDKKKHELVFFYPDVQTGDLVVRTLDAGSKDAAFYVDFDQNGVLTAVPCELPKNLAGERFGVKSGPADIASSPTTAATKEFVAYHLDPAKGSPVPVLLHALNTCEYLRVSVGSDAVNFFMHYADEDKDKDHKAVSCTYVSLNEKNPGAAGQYISLNTLSQRNQLLAAIRDFVNQECPGVTMQGTKITLQPGKAVGGGSNVKKPSGGKKTTTPDLDNSLTYRTLNYEFRSYFDEESEFAADLDKVAKTCYMTVEEDRLKVTIMVEDFETAQALPDGGTQVVEFVYSKLDTRPLLEHLDDITQMDLDNQFDRLTREEDRQTILENFLYYAGQMPHLIVEGNSFRSRRKGEELIDVAHCLTTAAMKHKIMKMFAPGSALVDVLRYSNVDFCQVAAYSRCVSFVYIDNEGETCEKFTYDFDELVGPELLEGDDCFGELKFGYEQELLSGLLGQGLATLPHLNVEYDVWVRVNPNVISKVSDVYQKPAEADEPDEPEIPEIPDVPDIPDIPAKPSLADSPTTQSLISQLADYFRDGGAFNLLMKNMQIAKATLNAGSGDVSVGFLQELPDGSLNVTGNFLLEYKNFGAGAEGSFTELDMDQQDELEEILWNEFPFLRN